MMPTRYQRRPKSNNYFAVTMRYAPETYERIRRYAYDHNMSIALANEELILKGLQRGEKSN